jgi:tripartite-type tricarboxylate transporter receptor subunit TctC
VITKVLVATVLAAAVVSPAALAQKYPTKPIRLISPFSPGGGTDQLARLIGSKASESFGQPVITDNRPGAGGAIGAETTVRAEPDGYTFIIVSATYAASSAYKPPPYDPINDIQGIAMIGTTGCWSPCTRRCR